MEASHEDEDADGSEEDLHAVLSGSIAPRKIPVNVYVASSDFDPAHHPLFDSSVPTFSACRLKIIMTSSGKPPISDVVEITVKYEPEKEKVVVVKVVGAMGSELSPDAMEEIYRRGGIFGLPGRLWNGMHAAQ
ncbi:hypothetical protein GLOTRDRAFT_95222 [Gloeophyllum trabeum ATCC 11539]|uniref:Uncharacterized protein n=1 Tax=Gloeophyllum trabeum (strain ATCC 11539 / FP-39264 / Madison 617) TaxID=670483 RepID=S7RKM6_GLOTA|nr:uncharacterized protein GLOTRDRAFT_95222 [Gloeophyllum trabeum ATCC 11539]EPQ53224.1 hypothetical protein GLOTRDRAFT_95222 [Gloeophyllum trabeum ATCC 11539]